MAFYSDLSMGRLDHLELSTVLPGKYLYPGRAINAALRAQIACIEPDQSLISYLFSLDHPGL